METAAALPPFVVRESARARRIRLTVSAREGLTLVVPRGWRGDATAIVSSKRGWAEQALSRVADRRALHLGGPEAMFPDSVSLRATGREYAVKAVPGARCEALIAGSELEVRGDGTDRRLDALRRWLDREARTHLPNRVAELAAEHGFEVARCRVRRARSRWGSCSAKGTISLNRNLMFLPPRLVDALILHELAHTRVFDHSPRFWAELAGLDGDALVHRRELKEAGRFVPAWADA